MKYLQVSILIFGLFFLTCSAMAQQPQDKTAPSETTPKILTLADSGKEIGLGLGNTIKLQLEFSGGTGFSWYIDGLDESRLKLIDEKVVDIAPRNPDRGPVSGGARLKVWSFKAVAPGDTVLRLLYYRVWEGKEHALNKFEVKLHVADKQ